MKKITTMEKTENFSHMQNAICVYTHIYMYIYGNIMKHDMCGRNKIWILYTYHFKNLRNYSSHLSYF